MENTSAPKITRRVTGVVTALDIPVLLEGISEAFCALKQPGFDLGTSVYESGCVVSANAEGPRRVVTVGIRYEFDSFAGTKGIRSELTSSEAKGGPYLVPTASYTGGVIVGQDVETSDVYDMVDRDLAVVFSMSRGVQGEPASD
jgi:hypothetical protein